MTRNTKLLLLGCIAIVVGLIYLVATSDTYKFYKRKSLTPISAQFTNFVDMYGKNISYEDVKGKRLLIAFGYTNCIDICPVTMASLTNILYEIEDTYGVEEANRYTALYFSVDPDRDTPQALYDVIYDIYHPNLIGLVGNMQQTIDISNQFRVTFRKSQDDPKYYTVAHTADIFVMDETGIYKTQFAHTAPPKSILPIIYKYFKEPK